MPKITAHGGPSDKDAAPGQYDDPEPAPAPEPAKSVKAPAVLKDEWTLADLRRELKSRNLSTVGSKTELLDRLAKADRK